MVFAERVELHLVGIEKLFPPPSPNRIQQQRSALSENKKLLLLNMMIPKMLIGWEKLNNH